ncbi:Oxidoreductase [Mortierella alpina]|nr:Oxidoreductase [Mortierella alpina]
MEPSEATTPSRPTSDNGDQSAAFNPETGEINWDCPCLGGMAKPPCGEAFKEAFSCFVFSTSEPKGFDCVEKFQAMQECFKAHPDVYGDELNKDDDEEEDETLVVSETEGGKDDDSEQKKNV